MRKIDVSTWRHFKCKDLFNCANTGNVLARDVTGGSGSIPFVTASAINNGVAAYIDGTGLELIEGNCLLIGGKTFTVTYQRERFVSNDSHNFVVRAKEASVGELSYLFLKTVIDALFKRRYTWSDAATKDKFLSGYIVLPAKENAAPDWNYMESLMKIEIDSSRDRLEKILRFEAARQTDTQGWRRFVIGDLFKIVKGTRLTKANMQEGTRRFIGASATNNGVTNYVGNDKNIHPKNVLTVAYNGSVGETFYQNQEFLASDDVNVLYPKFKLTENIALFLCPVIRQTGRKYRFVDKWKMEDMEKDSLLLPANKEGNPDWEYMEAFMSRVMKKSKHNLDYFRNITN